MQNENKRATEIFGCSLDSQRKFSIVFLPFLGTIYFFKFRPWSGRLRKTWRIIEKNKKGNIFPVDLDLKTIKLMQWGGDPRPPPSPGSSYNMNAN